MSVSSGKSSCLEGKKTLTSIIQSQTQYSTNDVFVLIVPPTDTTSLIIATRTKEFTTSCKNQRFLWREGEIMIALGTWAFCCLPSRYRHRPNPLCTAQ